MTIPRRVKDFTGIALFLVLWVLSFIYPGIETAWIIACGLFLFFSCVAFARGFWNLLLFTGSFVMVTATVWMADQIGSDLGLWRGLRTSDVPWSRRDEMIALLVSGLALWLSLKVADALLEKFGQKPRSESPSDCTISSSLDP